MSHDDAQDSALEQAIDEEFAHLVGTGLRVQRGNTTYPTPPKTLTIKYTKEHTMARTKHTIQNELTATNETIRSLEVFRDALQKELRAAGPVEPTQPRASVNVWFTPGGRRYEFLLIRTPRGEWFTTGTSEDVKRFRDWGAVAAWLTSADIFKYEGPYALVKESTLTAPF